MSRLSDKLNFLWEEEALPVEERSPQGGREPTGVPRPLRVATRWALIVVAATTLMGQVIGTRMVAPVDAATNYTGTCNSICDGNSNHCIQACGNNAACKQCCKTNNTTCHDFCQTCTGSACSTPPTGGPCTP